MVVMVMIILVVAIVVYCMKMVKMMTTPLITNKVENNNNYRLGFNVGIKWATCLSLVGC
jgi:hypothetical protein